MPANLEKTSQLYRAAWEVWLWIKELPEYQQAYKDWSSQVQAGKLLPFRIEKTNSKYSVRIYYDQLRITTKDLNGSALDKKIQDLKSRCEKKITPKRYQAQQRIERKWLFYPLAPPSFNLFPDCFFESFQNIFAGSLFKEAVRTLNVPRSVLFSTGVHGSPSDIPQTLNVAIDYKQSRKIIAKQLKEILNKFEDAYDIGPKKENKAKRPRLRSSIIDYQVRILKNIKVADRNIKKYDAGTDQFFEPAPDKDPTEAIQKAIQRSLKRVLTDKK